MQLYFFAFALKHGSQGFVKGTRIHRPHPVAKIDAGGLVPAGAERAGHGGVAAVE